MQNVLIERHLTDFV